MRVQLIEKVDFNFCCIVQNHGVLNSRREGYAVLNGAE
jgi:hypothetical protein